MEDKYLIPSLELVEAVFTDYENAKEADEYALRAKRIEIPASSTACEFYRKMGYDFKNGIDTVDAEQLYRLEKFRYHPNCS